ncbi:hypothetical protein GCK72_004160 [Caenorhabditis remanei]|uniref:Uncharacterized protein n=1 Tax=Caenorhabditis remanei TaxID=31234 RepID=A0A6A5HCW6_CAERE|nr:hypothetical protein GCK72_004160 [Caenorhabditis remanei]KAF1764213.1 hypothetical protein GCK72_004160 [Caenorhabditis remanei]
MNSRACYAFEDILNNETMHIFLEGCVVILLTICYLLVTLTLLIALHMVRRKRKTLAAGKSDNTSFLVIMMAVSFFISELLYSTLFILGNRDDPISSSKLFQLGIMLEYVAKILLTFNSIFHCFICFFLSTQYRTVVQRMLCLEKKNKMSFDNSVTISGYLLEYNRTQFVVFDTEQHRLKRGRISYDGDIQLTLGKFYSFNHGKTPETCQRASDTNIEFWSSRRNQGQMCARTWAVAPGDDVPLETRDEYKGKVWSPWLGLLNDPNGMFEKKFGKGGYGTIFVRYVNRENEVFEIDHVNDRKYDFVFEKPAPWSKSSGTEMETIIPSGRNMYIDAPGHLSGFLMEYNATHAMVFSTKDRLLKRGLITHDPTIRLELAARYYFDHLKPPNRRELPYNARFQFFAAGRPNPTVYARSWAVSPGENLPVEVREKYKGKVWAPYLGLINDKNGMFERRFGKGGRGSIRVLYVNRPDEVFELDHVDNVEYDYWAPDRPAPWNQPNVSMYYDEFPSRDTLASNGDCARFALCVREVADNLAYDGSTDGSTATCSLLVSSRYGVIRSLYVAEMGCWYQHSIRKRTRRSNDPDENPNYNVHMNFTASKIMKIQPPLPTEVVDGGKDVEVTTKFVFEHDHFEKEWSRGLSDWKERMEGVPPKVFFYNVYLEKVRISHYSAIHIIKLVENLRKDCYERMKTDPINVIVKVRLLKNFLEMCMKHPDNELYVVKTVVDVEYVD